MEAQVRFQSLETMTVDVL